MKLLLAITILFCSTLVYSQPNSPKLGHLQTKLDTINLKVDYSIVCMNKFRKEKQLSFGLVVVGAAVIWVTRMDAINGTDRIKKEHSQYFTGDLTPTEYWAVQTRMKQAIADKAKPIENFGIYAGVACGATAAVLQIISYRHLGRAYVFSERNGLGIGLKF